MKYAPTMQARMKRKMNTRPSPVSFGPSEDPPIPSFAIAGRHTSEESRNIFKNLHDVLRGSGITLSLCRLRDVVEDGFLRILAVCNREDMNLLLLAIVLDARHQRGQRRRAFCILAVG